MGFYVLLVFWFRVVRGDCVGSVLVVLCCVGGLFSRLYVGIGAFWIGRFVGRIRVAGLGIGKM